MPKKINLIGQVFTKLTVLAESGYRHGRIAWLCCCECGTEKVCTGNDLQRGRNKSCGLPTCREYSVKEAHQASTVHGMCTSRLYSIWSGMKRRCSNPNSTRYNYYGGRGVTVCSDWLVFTDFKNWALSTGYTDELTLDRINSDGNYSPSNCRWATRKQQARNTRSNKRITYQGKTQTAAEWAEELNLNSKTLLYRLNAGWTIEKSFNTEGAPYERSN